MGRPNEFTQTRRRRIIAMDGGACRKCFHPHGLRVHHIVPRVDGGTNDRHNLITLCEPCHREWHNVASGSIAFERWLSLPPMRMLLDVLSGGELDLSVSVQKLLSSMRLAMLSLGRDAAAESKSPKATSKGKRKPRV